MQDYCWFSTDFEHSTPRLGGLGRLPGEAGRLSVLCPRAGPQHSVPDLSADRLEVKTMEMKTPR